MSDRDDTRDFRVNTRESGSSRAGGLGTHPINFVLMPL